MLCQVVIVPLIFSRTNTQCVFRKRECPELHVCLKNINRTNVISNFTNRNTSQTPVPTERYQVAVYQTYNLDIEIKSESTTHSRNTYRSCDVCTLPFLQFQIYKQIRPSLPFRGFRISFPVVWSVFLESRLAGRKTSIYRENKQKKRAYMQHTYVLSRIRNCVTLQLTKTQPL